MPRSAAPVMACRKMLCEDLTNLVEEVLACSRYEEYNELHVQEAARIVKNALRRTHG